MSEAAVEVRPAATVMVIRDDEHEQVGIEVFMLRRSLGAVFGSGMYVFPGGRVEESDGAAGHHEHPNPERDVADHAFRVAAIREAFEEAGVLLALDAGGSHVTDGHPALDARKGVHDGTVDFAELCAQHDLEPAVDELAWVAHWITPAGESPRRFDTRFYVAPAPTEQALSHDDSETIDSLWVRPAEALRRQRAGELTMMPPTIANLEFLAAFSTVSDAMAAAKAMPPPPCILPKIRTGADGTITGVAMPGDDDYDALG